jgi:hypothetical protein
MTHALVGAKSGWGKSWLCQWWTEDNVPEYDHLLVLDYKDEYRGLVKANLAHWGIGGPDEVGVGADAWKAVLEQKGALVLARHRLRTEEWRDVCAAAIRAARRLDGTALVVIDEAHFVAPQSGSYPDTIEGLATTGRGEGVSSMWVTQRLARLDETVVAQMMVRLLGGFSSTADLNKVGGVVDYPEEVHNPQVSTVRGLPSDLEASDGPVPVRKFTENGQTQGSEWIYSTDGGDTRRVDSRALTMQSTHHGPEGEGLSTPG